MAMLFIGSKVNFEIKNLPMLAILLRRANRVKMKYTAKLLLLTIQ